MKKRLLAITFISALALVGSASASDQHEHGHDDEHAAAPHHHDEGGMSHGESKMFLEKRSVDGYEVSFHVMKAQSGKEMGGSHDFMIKVEKDGKVVTDVVMNTKVIFPDGKSETKPTMKMGDWMMAGYDLDHAGRHQMMILFKTADGTKHKAGVYYSAE